MATANGTVTGASPSGTLTTVWTLRAEMEIRCEVPDTPDTPLTLRLVSGSAEIFGVEMAVNREYVFVNDNLAVFTWYGCVLESSGSGQIYESDSTPMVAYVNTHVQLEAMRDVAFANGERGPRVIVVGPKDHGKSTICRILSAYAARLDRSPVFVDLDVGQGSLSIPGCVCATPVSKTSLSIEEGYVQSTPLVYYYGYASPGDNSKLYMQLTSTLATRVDGRLDRDSDTRASGLIINTCGWIDATGYDLLMHCISAFAVDVVLVMGHDKLFSKITADAADHVTVVKLPKSGGVVERVRGHCVCETAPLPPSRKKCCFSLPVRSFLSFPLPPLFFAGCCQ
jgi:polyribonucleotide 5'-hydroxyl-kinase